MKSQSFFQRPLNRQPITWIRGAGRAADLAVTGFLITAVALIAIGCRSVGPDYTPPANQTTSQYKSTQLGTWKMAEPTDAHAKGDWWETFGDPLLNELERQAQNANQDLRAAFHAIDQARASARIARSELLPSLSTTPGFRRERFSPNQEPDFGSLTANTFSVPLDLTYEVDLWGRVRRGLEGARADAAASIAAYHQLMLVLQADVAQNYFAIRALDAEIETLQRTIGLRRDQLQIVASRFDTGLGTELDVVRAESELAIVEAERADLARRRVELENALAVLVGETPSTFRLAATMPSHGTEMSLPQPPTVPAGLPSQLLERRPDVAEAERRLAADNARIGVAKAAFFPVLRLTGSGGYLSADVESLFDWESRAWTIGPSVSLPLFAGGRNKAGLERARAAFEGSVARYRQQVLLAFADVENALAGVHYLTEQTAARQRAWSSASRAKELALESFATGITDYLDVIDADRAALQNQRILAQLQGERLIASVQLIKALGGGWQSNTSAATSPDEIAVASATTHQ